MTTPRRNERGKLRLEKLFSPKGFLLRAALIGLCFLIVHAAGWREHTTFLTGTPADAATSMNQTILFGVVYLVAYFSFVIVAPILVFAAGIFALANLIFAKQAQQATGS